MVPVEYFFVLSALLFFIGVFGFISRRNLIAMLISVELILNAVDLNFAAINRIVYPGALEGFFFSLFSAVLHRCECRRDSRCRGYHHQCLPQLS